MFIYYYYFLDLNAQPSLTNSLTIIATEGLIPGCYNVCNFQNLDGLFKIFFRRLIAEL